MKLDEVGARTESFMRVRSMKNAGFDSEWHPLKIDEKFEVMLAK